MAKKEIETVTERRKRIKTVNPANPIPLDTLDQTESWALSVAWGAEVLWDTTLKATPEAKGDYLTWLQHKIQEERRQVEDFYNANRNRGLEPLRPESWLRQRNTHGMETCQIASAINALRFLGVYDQGLHAEEKFMEALGRLYAAGGIDAKRFASLHPGGTETSQIARIIPELAPNVGLRGSNSVAEIIKAANEGAAVIFPLGTRPPHVVLIPPGFQLRRGVGGRLEVQVADSLRSEPNFIPIDEMIRSEISTFREEALQKEPYKNSVLILFRADQQGSITPRGVRTGIETVRPGIRTVKPGIVTVRGGR